MPTEHTLHGHRIRGLTLWRPWPWAFTHAGKRVENRSWKPPRMIVGGYVALHCGLTFDHGACVGMQEGLFGAPATAIDPREDEHPHSLIVAVARVEGFHEMYPRVGADLPDGDAVWEFGPYVWRLPRVSVLPSPVPCKGSQGLWRLPADVFGAIAEQMEGCD